MNEDYTFGWSRKNVCRRREQNMLIGKYAMFFGRRKTLDSSWEKFEVTSGQTAAYQQSLQATRGWHAGRRKNVGSQ